MCLRFWGIDANALKSRARCILSLRYEIGGFGEGRVSPMEDRRWGETISYNRPQWEGGVNIRYMPVRPFTLEAGYEFAAGREYSNLGKLSDIHLVHLKASYAFTSWFSLYGLTGQCAEPEIRYSLRYAGTRHQFHVRGRFEILRVRGLFSTFLTHFPSLCVPSPLYD